MLAYNQTALEVATRMGVPVNDLYAVIMKAGRDECLSEDGGHLTPAGYELLGKAVAAFIREQLMS